MLAEEEASLPTKGGKGKQQPARGLDLSAFDDNRLSDLNATGIDAALDALDLTSNTQQKIDRHPERRYPAALAAYQERRMEEMKNDPQDKQLRRQQKIAQIKKEFEKHEDNPFNQLTAGYNADKEDIAAMRDLDKKNKEKMLATK